MITKNEHPPKGYLFYYTNGTISIADGEGGQEPINILELIKQRDDAHKENKQLKKLLFERAESRRLEIAAIFVNAAMRVTGRLTGHAEDALLEADRLIAAAAKEINSL